MGPRRVQLHSEEQDWELGTKQWFWPWFLSPKSFRASSKEKQTRRVPSGPGDPAASPSGRRSCPSGVCKDLSCEHRTLLGRSPRRQKCCSPALESQRARAPCLLAAPRPLPCALLPALAPGLRAPPEAPRAAQTRGGVGGGGVFRGLGAVRGAGSWWRDTNPPRSLRLQRPQTRARMSTKAPPCPQTPLASWGSAV